MGGLLDSCHLKYLKGIDPKLNIGYLSLVRYIWRINSRPREYIENILNRHSISTPGRFSMLLDDHGVVLYRVPGAK